MPIGKNDHRIPERVEASFTERPSNLDSLDGSLDDERDFLRIDNRAAVRDAPSKKRWWSSLGCGGACFRKQAGHRPVQLDGCDAPSRLRQLNSFDGSAPPARLSVRV
eukprot:COSAG01_NODE_6314_length_3741_cov_18.754256_5_plen_107_part_00